MTPNAESPTATILVVDDNEANRLLAAHTLQDENYRVVLAGGGVEGIAAFEKERPDCVLLDVRMPDMDGFTVCERIPGASAWFRDARPLSHGSARCRYLRPCSPRRR